MSTIPGFTNGRPRNGPDEPTQPADEREYCLITLAQGAVRYGGYISCARTKQGDVEFHAFSRYRSTSEEGIIVDPHFDTVTFRPELIIATQYTTLDEIEAMASRDPLVEVRGRPLNLQISSLGSIDGTIEKVLSNTAIISYLRASDEKLTYHSAEILKEKIDAAIPLPYETLDALLTDRQRTYTAQLKEQKSQESGGHDED